MNQVINYSIIIPHKNTPDLLQRCLDSIPRRGDIQIIVVDDNSDPNKIDFVKFPGINDVEVEIVFTKENKGAGYARNIGLLEAKGNWLIFADADDFFTSSLISVIDGYCDSDADIVYFTPISVDSDTLLPSYRGAEFQVMINNALLSNSYDELRYRYLVPHSKLIRKSLIDENSIKFDETKANNDCLFSVKIGYYAKNIFPDINSIYCITNRKGSLMNTFSEDITLERLRASVNVNKFLKSVGKMSYRINLIPLIFVRNSPKFKAIIDRLKEVKYTYFFTYFLFDMMSIFMSLIYIYINKEKRSNYKIRRSIATQ